MGGWQDQGFAALPLTRRPGQTEWSANDLSGRYWLRADDRYVEEPREAAGASILGALAVPGAGEG
ncbi:hypothetical protein [Leisingera sp.]|uniref:hypothetical protein n=1 Tax=Leisingera sp. TaxID=1879318 RepID=UPI002B265A4D|nr:hypothetical protein [Leisingera sp.]